MERSVMVIGKLGWEKIDLNQPLKHLAVMLCHIR